VKTGIEVLDGIAGSIPLASGSVDAVTVAQAFHWFDAEAAIAESTACFGPAAASG
jgi:Methyltransferase domain